MHRLFFNKFAPRWAIFFIDVVILCFAFYFAFFISERFSINLGQIIGLLPAFFVNIIVGVICILEFSTHKGIIRYSEMKDIMRVAKLALLQLGIWLFIMGADQNKFLTHHLSLEILIINLFVVIFGMVAFRIFVKEIYHRAHKKTMSAGRSMIFGAGEMGLITKNVLMQDAGLNTQLIGFLDDNHSKIGKELGGLPIFNASGDRVNKLLKQYGITQLYIAISNLSVDRKVMITDMCGPLKIKVHMVPPFNEWTDGALRKTQIKEMNIEELLEREEIVLPKNLLDQIYDHATVLVTGAAGSIGSEICRQLCRNRVRKLVLLDQSESGLFDLENELVKKFNGSINLQIEIASVRDERRLKGIFATHKPEFVFHAAAYKHVPMMEIFPCEAILTNVFGTKLVAELCQFHHVKKFVLVSTDKAVNPTNIMGATKRISELFVQSLSDQENSKTQFIITRFGNVLGSAGSVVPTFKKQIEEGGPVTITHPEITRYFMTIPEASKLVLEAGKLGQSGDILLFDMGKPVKIIDLAKRMIQLAGYRPYKDIDIQHTGLRPGEKMYEELFKDTETCIATNHPRILKAIKSTDTNKNFSDQLVDLEINARLHDCASISTMLTNILPEFKPYQYKGDEFVEEVIKIANG